MRSQKTRKQETMKKATKRLNIFEIRLGGLILGSGLKNMDHFSTFKVRGHFNNFNY